VTTLASEPKPSLSSSSAPTGCRADREYSAFWGVGSCHFDGTDDKDLWPSADALTHGKGFEVTLDLLGGAYLVASIQAAARRGRIMLIGTIAGRTATVPLGMILVKRLLLRGTVLRARSIEEKRAATAAFARDVLPLLASGTVLPTVDRVYELDEIRAAHERLASNETFGKVVLRM